MAFGKISGVKRTTAPSPTPEITRVTLLNKTSPYQRVIDLDGAITDNDVCTTVLEAKASEIDYTLYNCNFDNGCSDNFETNELIEYDSGMKLLPKTFEETKTVDTLPSEYDVDMWEFSEINRSEWNTIDSFLFIIDDYSSDADMTVTGTNSPQFIKANDDISLLNVTRLEGITVSFTGDVLMLISVDSGATWESYDGYNWNTVNTLDINEIESNSMNQTTINALTSEDLESLLGYSDTIRFGYYIPPNSVNQSIELKVEMSARNEIAIQSEYDYELHISGTKLVYDFTFTGTKTFVINYIDS